MEELLPQQAMISQSELNICNQMKCSREYVASGLTRGTKLLSARGVHSCLTPKMNRSSPPSSGVMNPNPLLLSEIEEDENGLLESLSSQKTHSSLPDLLQQVLLIEYEKVKERQAVLVLAIHAVTLETGFVLQQPMGVVDSSDRCGLSVDWSGKGGLVNLIYTLPEIIRAASAGAQRLAVGNALLRCQVIGNALVVYGVVTGAQGFESTG
jgi:hypothetical protein